MVLGQFEATTIVPGETHKAKPTIKNLQDIQFGTFALTVGWDQCPVHEFVWNNGPKPRFALSLAELL